MLEISRGSSGAKQWVMYQTLGAVTFTVTLTIRMIQFSASRDKCLENKNIQGIKTLEVFRNKSELFFFCQHEIRQHIKHLNRLCILMTMAC